MLFSELKSKEVVNLRDCRKMGHVTDFEFDECSGVIQKIIVPGIGGKNWKCLFGCDTEYAIAYQDIKQIGPDVIMVDEMCIRDRYLRKDGQEKKIADVTVAVGPGRLSRSGGYQMILHPALLEEKKGADHDIKSSDAGKSAV